MREINSVQRRHPNRTPMPELPWMALFAWYVIVMMQMDAGGVAAIST